MSGEFIHRDHEESYLQLYDRDHETFPIPLKYVGQSFRGEDWDYNIPADPTSKTSWATQVSWWKTYEDPKDYQTRQYMAWSLDTIIHPRNKYVHTLTCRTHIFQRQRTHCVLCTSSCVCTYTHGSSVCKKVFAHVSYLSISPSPFSRLTRLCCSCTVTSRPLPATTSLTPTSTSSCRTFPS